jgi:hypothetical protein
MRDRIIAALRQSLYWIGALVILCIVAVGLAHYVFHLI